MSKPIEITDESVISKIYLIRSKKVMLDRDLAEMYGVETRALNQAVKRNLKRFPPDFMFQMTEQELENWISQSVISNKEKMGWRKLPNVFTEEGERNCYRSKYSDHTNFQPYQGGTCNTFRHFVKTGENRK